MYISRASKPARQRPRAKKACLSCQRQHRLCDKTIPKCQRCTRARRECDGYPPDVIRTYVYMDAENIFHPNKKRLLCDSLAGSDRLVQRCNASTKSDLPNLSHDANSILLRPDFYQHLEVLWGTFLSSYSKTEDYWPTGCQLLVRHSKVLDFALIALCAERLAVDSPSNDLSVLGLTAYNKSLGLYRDQMHSETASASLKALLAATSTVYALMDAALMRPAEIVHTGWGDFGHFDGALSMIQRSGPSVFSFGGFHLVFKKIREMGVFLALARSEPTFLEAEAWLNIPWIFQPKSWRDMLYDLALRFSGIMAEIRHPRQKSPQEDVVAKSALQELLCINEDLDKWRAAWLAHEYPELSVRCTCRPVKPLSCICPVIHKVCPPVALTLLQLECWALQLLVCALLAESDVHCADDSWVVHVRTRESSIASNMEAALASTPFKQTESSSKGITEATCRSILATWALGEYKAGRSQVTVE